MDSGSRTGEGGESLIFHYKLTPPSIPKALERPRLLELVVKNDTRPLVVISADAGYGKTTLMSQLYTALGELPVWYQIDERDHDPVVLLSHLAEAVDHYIPGFAQSLTWNLSHISDSDRDREAALTAFISEMSEKASSPIYFYLDDFQIINNDERVTSAFNFLITNMPEGFRVFIAGREKPNLPLARLRSQRRLLEIEKAELQFTLKESAILLSRATERNIPESQLKSLHKQTEGWAAALALTGNLLKRGEIDTTVLEQLTPVITAGYLTDEIWSELDQTYQIFFMECSLLDPIDVEVCDRVLPVESSCAKLLRVAEERNLMTLSLVAGSTYRFHPLFREFLMDKLLQEKGPEEVRKLHVAFAEAYWNMGNVNNAIDHFFEADDFEKAAMVIESCGIDVMNAGRLRTMEAWLSRVPANYYKKHPWLFLFKSELAERRGDLSQSLNYLSRAESGFKKTADGLGRFKTAMARGEVLSNLTQYQKSLKAYEGALRWAESSLEKINVLNRIAVTQLLLGNTGKSLGYFARAKELCDDSMEEKRLSISIAMLNPGYFTGDFHSIFSSTDTLMAKMHHMMTSHDRLSILFYRILVLFEMALYEDSLRTLDEAGAELVGEYMGFERAFRCLRAQNLLYHGEAAAGRKIIRRIFDEDVEHKLLGPDCALIHIGAHERSRGNYQKAATIHSEALEICRAEEKPYAIASALQHLGADHIRMSEDSTDNGQIELDEAYEIARESQYEYIKSQVHFHRAWLALSKGDRERAIAEMTSCLNLAAQFRHDHFMVQEGKNSPELLGLAYEHNLERGYLAEIFQKAGSESIHALKPLLGSTDDHVRKAVIVILAAIGGVATTSQIRRLTRDKSPSVQKAAEEALEKIRTAAGSPEKILSQREMDVLRLVSDGLSNLDIGARLFISEATVKTHITHIFNKLGLNKRSQAVAYYHQKHALEDDS